MEELDKTLVPAFILAGNCLVTIESGTTYKHFTYKIKQSSKVEGLYFVKQLRNKDNTKDYTYVGCYYATSGIFVAVKPYKERHSSTWPSGLRAIYYTLLHLNKLPDNLHVYHEGRCGRCGRLLTTPESIKRGLGPECCKMIGG